MITLLSCRALAGFIGSAVFALYGGSLADMFSPDERGSLVALFTVVLQGAPTIGPVPSSLLGTIVHWRWLMGCIAVWAAIITVVVICLPETEANAIRRRITHQQGLGFPKDRNPAQSLDIWGKALSTPISKSISIRLVYFDADFAQQCFAVSQLSPGPHSITHLSMASCFSFSR
jgi:MFS family permease